MKSDDDTYPSHLEAWPPPSRRSSPISHIARRRSSQRATPRLKGALISFRRTKRRALCERAISVKGGPRGQSWSVFHRKFLIVAIKRTGRPLGSHSTPSLPPSPPLILYRNGSLVSTSQTRSGSRAHHSPQESRCKTPFSRHSHGDHTGRRLVAL